MVVPQKGDHVWIEPKTSGNKNAIQIGAKIKDVLKDQITVVDDDGNEYILKPGTKIRHMHISSLSGVDDMISLGDLNEAGILRNLFIRYNRNEIYTYTGRILVAVNPYTVLPIYTANEIKSYKNKKIGELPPHIFAIADNAYNNMRRFLTNQSIIISGESGAGKTESTKLILQFLAAASGQHSWIEQQVLDSNPILEAFGNAKTIRNDNSSRFGKYIDIYFGANGAMEGAKIEQYLLEKSRIVSQMKDERNYHIFYCMLSGLPAREKEQLGLRSADHYHYLNQGGVMDMTGCTDIVTFATIRSAMKVLTFTDDECQEIFKLLAAFLHIGNLIYEAQQKDTMDSCEVADNNQFKYAAKLLQVAGDDLRKALTTKTIITRDDMVVTHLPLEQAINIRDALVKGIYGRLFVWIVAKINTAIYRPSLNTVPKSSTKASPSTNFTSIGVLDIFGFENFDVNSFEQLCINFANENLQQFFVRHIFKLEQEEYAAEIIDWQHISFVDNQETLDLIANKNCNILALIDEESRFPKGTDESLLSKLITSSIKHPRFIKHKADITKLFGIEHFAGSVHYQVDGFLEKNRDTFNADLIDLIQTTKSSLLKTIFDKDLSMGFDTRKRAPTLALQFKRSLDSLMNILVSRQPFFVRCIKPNEFKRKQDFDRSLCLRQLRYSGMMETIRIRKAGYPIRHRFVDFIDRYRLLVPGVPTSARVIDAREATKTICKKILDSKDYQIGKTKLFLKDSQDIFLEELRDLTVTSRVVLIQKVWKGFIARRYFVNQKRAAVTIQKYTRKLIAKRKYQKFRKGICLFQAVFRTRIARRKMKDLRGFIVNIQRYSRGYLARFNLRRRKAAIVKIQSHIRKVVAMKKYRKMREEKIKMIEALMLKKEEERILKRKMDEQRAQVEAEKRHQERINKMKQESAADCQQQRQKSNDQLRQIAEAEIKRTQPVDESKMLDEIFGSFDEYNSPRPNSTQSIGPRAFRDLEQSRNHALNNAGAAFDSLIPDYLVNILDEDVSDFTFSKFAATYFQKDMDEEFSRKPIKRPLLVHSNPNDQMAAIAVWIVILRFMKDLPEPVVIGGRGTNPTSMMSKIYQSLGRSVNPQDLLKAAEEAERLEVATPYETANRKNIVSLTLKKKSKFTEEVVNQLRESEKEPNIGDIKSLLEERPTTNLEKLHFIIGNGILRPQLRDEIYCQICKQITGNPRQESVSRGLILLTLCIGCFAPTERFVRTLRNFIQTNFPSYSSFVVNRLQRTFSNGTRNQPPSWLELKAIKNKEPIILATTCMNGSTETIFADSASTAQELCSILCQKIGIKDQFGFSLFIAIQDKVSSLGSGSDHVMDAISQCEQFAKEKGITESKAQWRLFFRKEIFTPWYNPCEDPVSTNLIYHQIIRGIKFGEYRCDTDDDLAKICAYALVIDNLKEPFDDVIARYVPPFMFSNTKDSNKYWVSLITKHFKSTIQGMKSPVNRGEKLKDEIVSFAKSKWPMLFSRFYEASKFSGPTLDTNDIIFTVNWTGIYLVDSNERIHMEFSFPEVVAVSSSRTSNFLQTRTNRFHGQSLSLSTIQGDVYTFNSSNAEDIRDLIIMFLEGLKQRSRYVIALQSFSKPDPNYLSCEKGDLIILPKDDKVIPSVGLCYGENYRTKKTGDFPAEIVYILPTMTCPQQNILGLFSDRVLGDQSDGGNRSSNNHQHTMEEFSKVHFRSSPSNRSFSMGSNDNQHEDLWKFSTHPLKYSLFKKLLHKEDLSQLAIGCFNAIMGYMGDMAVKDLTSNELTEIIFDPCLKHEALKDEVYCQMFKQITCNKNSQSTKAGWELLWLATGIMAPSSNVYRELQELFRTAQSPVASECQMRLQRTLKCGQRRYPPHIIEINSIQKEKIIHHKIYFPNESSEAFEITSNTKCKDLSHAICTKIGLRDSKGFALFVKSVDKAISMPEGDFFFDFIRQLSDWVFKHKPSKDGKLDFNYQVFFMRKLWTNAIPGLDKVADTFFHFPQELRKYLYGYHKVSSKDAVVLGGLLLRINCGDDVNKMMSMCNQLTAVVPQDMISKFPAAELKEKLISQYKVSSPSSEDVLKTNFLKYIFQWPTFGSAFFEVKQSTNHNVPEKILIAINKSGVYLIHTKSKEILEHYPYSSISNWSSGNTYFNMTIGNLIHGKKLLCETPLGYKMDDLLTSYISLMLTTVGKGLSN